MKFQIRLVPLWVLGFALAVLCTWCNVAHAQTTTMGAKLTFTPPTTHTDGSPLTGALTYYALYGAKGTAASSKTRYGTPLKPDGSVVIPNMAAGTCFQLVTSEMQTSGVPVESSPTNESCLPFPPNGPTNVTVTVTIQITSP